MKLWNSYQSFVNANALNDIYGFLENILWMVVTIIVNFGKIDNTSNEYGLLKFEYLFDFNLMHWP